MSVSSISPIQRAWTWGNNRPTTDPELLEAIRDLSARLDAAEARLAAELDARVEQIVRQHRQRDRRITARIDDALRHQTDELLVTIDAWLPAAEDKPSAPPRRVRRGYVWTLVAAVIGAPGAAAAAIAANVVPYPF